MLDLGAVDGARVADAQCSRMPRPKHADSAETWEKIVRAARELIRTDEDGKADVSLRAVAKRAGCSLGTIQYYFDSKERLLEHCLDTYYDALLQVSQQLAELLRGTRREDAPTVISQGVRVIYRFALGERDRLKLRVVTNAARGIMHPHRDPSVLASRYLNWFVPLLVPLVDIDERSLRTTMQSMTFLIVQYVLLQDADVATIVGVGGDEGRQAIEDHVVETANRLLFRR